MKRNIGPKNRIARLVAGIVLIVLGLLYLNQNQIASPVAIVVGIVLILEAAFAYCIVHGIRGTKDMR